MLKINEGKIDRAQKVVIYGSEGIGKSTFASKFPEALFIDTEGGTSHMDVRRIDKLESWEELVNIVNEVATEPVCKTLVIDTAYWAEQLCISHICRKYKQNSIESFGYGKGYTYLSEEFSRLLSACDAVIKSGKHVVIVAHAKMRKQELPDEAGAFDRWEMKLSRQVAPLIKEWADLLLFLNYRTYVVSTESNSKKAQGGKRVMFASHHPCWDAKNRHGLADELDLDFSSIAHLFTGKKNPPAKKQAPLDGKTPLETLRALMKEADISEDALKMIVARKCHYTEEVPIDDYPEEFVSKWLLAHWEQIVALIKPNTSNNGGTDNDR